MHKVKATASLWLDTRRSTKDNTYPVLIRVYYVGTQFGISLKMYATKTDFDRALSDKRLNVKQKELRDTMVEHRTKAQSILDVMDVITPHTFKQQFFAEINILSATNLIDIESQFKAYIYQMKQDGRHSTAVWYECAMKSLIDFRGNIHLQNIDPDYLKKYQVWMKNKGNSSSTTLCYLQKLRTIFNIAISKNILNRKYYPFGKSGFSLWSSTQSKKALYPQEVENFWNYKPKTKAQKEAKDFWFFLYLSSGCNPIDALKLRWKDVSMANSTITFIRSKTASTVQNVKPIMVYMHDECKRIIEVYSSKEHKAGDYIFPVLKGCHTDAAILKRTTEWKRHVNRCLNRIGKTLGYEQPLTLSVSRHSFATALNLNGTPMSFISEAMGHTSMKTTSIYLSSIPSSMKKDISSTLLDFGSKLKAV